MQTAVNNISPGKISEVERRDDINPNATTGAYLVAEVYGNKPINLFKVDGDGLRLSANISSKPAPHYKPLYIKLADNQGNYILNYEYQKPIGNHQVIITALKNSYQVLGGGWNQDQNFWNTIENSQNSIEDIIWHLTNDQFWYYDQNGYKVFDGEKWGDYYRRLQALYNILIVLGMMLKLQQDLRRIVDQIMNKTKYEERMDIVEIANREAQTHLGGQIALMQEQFDAIRKFNEAKLKEAQEKARAEAQKRAKKRWWEKACDWLFGTEWNKTHEDMEYAKANKELLAQYEAAMKANEESFLKAMRAIAGYKANINWHDSFLNWTEQEEAEVFGNFSEENLVNKNAGGGKYKYWDLNKNYVIALRMRLTALENMRRVYVRLKELEGELAELVKEEMTGIKIDHKSYHDAFHAIMNNLARFEKLMLNLTINTVIDLINAHNDWANAAYEYDAAKARFWRETILGIVGIVGLVFGGLSDIIGMRILDAIVDGIHEWLLEKSTNNTFKPSEVNLDEVWKYLENLGQRRTVQEGSDPTADMLAWLEQQEWEIYLKLDNNSLKLNAGDGFQALDGDEIARLRTELIGIETVKQIYVALMALKGKLREVVHKKLTGIEGLEFDGMVKESMAREIEDKMLTFQLKVDTLAKQVQENNKQRMEQLNAQKAFWTAIGTFIGTVVAAVAIAFTIVTCGAGLAVIAACVGLLASFSALGAGVSNLIFSNQHNKVNPNLIKGDIFVGDPSGADNLFGSFDLDMAGLINDMNSEDLSMEIGGGRNGWLDRTLGTDYQLRGINPNKATEIRDKLTKIYFRQMCLLMIEKARASIRDIVEAQMTGTSANIDHFGGLKFALDKHYENKVQAFEYRLMMVNEEINAQNRQEWLDAEIRRGWVDTIISTIGVITSLVAPYISSWIGDLIGIIGSVAGTGAQWYYAKVDSMPNFGKLASDECKKYLMEQLQKKQQQQTGNIMDQLDQAELEATLEMNLELVESLGRGYIGINPRAYLQLERRIDRIYNIRKALAQLQALKGQIKNIVAQTMGMAVAEGTLEELLMTIYAQRGNAQKQLSLMYDRVRTFVERWNQINDARIRRHMLEVTLAFTLVYYALTKAKIDQKLIKLIGIEGGDISWLGKINKADLALTIVKQMLTNPGVSGLVGKWIAESLTLDSEMKSMEGKAKVKIGSKKVSQSIYDGKEFMPTGDPTGDAIGRAEADAWQAQLKMADIELQAQKFEFEKRSYEMLMNLIGQIADPVAWMKAYQEAHQVREQVAVIQRKLAGEISLPEALAQGAKIETLINQEIAQKEDELKAKGLKLTEAEKTAIKVKNWAEMVKFVSQGTNKEAIAQNLNKLEQALKLLIGQLQKENPELAKSLEDLAKEIGKVKESLNKGVITLGDLKAQLAKITQQISSLSEGILKDSLGRAIKFLEEMAANLQVQIYVEEVMKGQRATISEEKTRFVEFVKNNLDTLLPKIEGKNLNEAINLFSIIAAIAEEQGQNQNGAAIEVLAKIIVKITQNNPVEAARILSQHPALISQIVAKLTPEVINKLKENGLIVSIEETPADAGEPILLDQVPREMLNIEEISPEQLISNSNIYALVNELPPELKREVLSQLDEPSVLEQIDPDQDKEALAHAQAVRKLEELSAQNNRGGLA